MSLPKKLESLAARYERNPVLRALFQLVQLVPYGVLVSAADAALVARLQNVRAERARIFFDELAKGEQELQPELLENNEFLHCYFSTTEAALRTHRTEKIQALARLLRSAVDEERIGGIDEYEELLSIIDGLSHRELCILAALAKYEDDLDRPEVEHSLPRANLFWNGFVDDIVRQLAIEPNEVNSMLNRLNRSGCYETFIGTYAGYTGGRGMTTPLFRRLRELALGGYNV